MSKIQTWVPSTLAELRDAIEEMITEAGCNGRSADEVYFNLRDVALESETLSDGSNVLNLNFRVTK